MDEKHIPGVESAIRLYMRANSLTQQDLADRLGVSQTAVGKLITGGFGRNSAKKWAAVFGFDPQFLVTGQGQLMAEGRLGREPSEGVPLLPVFAQGGSLIDFSDSISNHNCERIVSPIAGAELAVPIYGDSMAPEFPNGAIVFLKRIDESAFIEWGKPHVVDTVNGSVIKFLAPGSDGDHIKCISANPEPMYAPFEIAREDVLGVYRVLLCMSMK
jgi:transcriptional regulator with XRE-family HTH domain